MESRTRIPQLVSHNVIDKLRSYLQRDDGSPRALVYLGAVLAAIGYGAWLMAPMLSAWAVQSDDDYMRFLVSRAAPWRVLTLYGEMPMRTPQLDGGSLLGHPHDATLHPAIFLTYLFGPFVGLKLEIFLLWLGGVVGTFLLVARGLRLPRWTAVYGAALMASFSWTCQHIFGGDIPELQYLLTPLLLTLFLEARRSRAALVGAALLLASIATISAYRVILIAMVPLIFLPLQTLCMRDSAELLRPRLLLDFKRLAIGNLAAIGLAAPKLLPTLWTLYSDSRRSSESFDQTFFTAQQLFSKLVHEPQQHTELFDWTHYIGWTAVVLAIVGLSNWRKAAAPALIVVGAGAACMGDNLPINVFALLQNIPGLFAITAAPKQFNFFFLFGILLLSCVGTERIWTLLSPRPRVQLIAVALLFGVSVQQVWWSGQVGRAMLRYGFDQQLVRAPRGMAADALLQNEVVVPTEAPLPFMSLRLDSPRLEDKEHVEISSEFELPFLLYWLMMGQGGGAWWDSGLSRDQLEHAYSYVESAGVIAPNPNYRGEIYGSEGTNCSLSVLHFSSRRIVADTACEGPSLIVVNQRWLRGWSARVQTAGANGWAEAPLELWTGSRSDQPRSLIGVWIPSGAERLELRYTPFLFLPGLGLGFLSLILLWWWGTRREEEKPAHQALSIASRLSSSM